MSKKGYLTSAEYKALRQLLGFSQPEAAAFHKVQNVRTIQRWETGTSWPSELACDKICALAEQIEWSIDQAVKQFSAFSPDEVEVTLIVYPDECYRKFVVNMGDLPNSVHRAMISRTFAILRKKGYSAGVVEFNAQDYFSYLAIHGLGDSQDARAAWASDYRARILLN